MMENSEMSEMRENRETRRRIAKEHRSRDFLFCDPIDINSNINNGWHIKKEKGKVVVDSEGRIKMAKQTSH